MLRISPSTLRKLTALGALGLVAIVGLSLFITFSTGALWGLVLMLILSLCGVEHWGYWPRWFWIGAGASVIVGYLTKGLSHG